MKSFLETMEKYLNEEKIKEFEIIDNSEQKDKEMGIPRGIIKADTAEEALDVFAQKAGYKNMKEAVALGFFESVKAVPYKDTI
jgi:hypothetical protein